MCYCSYVSDPRLDCSDESSSPSPPSALPPPTLVISLFTSFYLCQKKYRPNPLQTTLPTPPPIATLRCFTCLAIACAYRSIPTNPTSNSYQHFLRPPPFPPPPTPLSASATTPTMLELVVHHPCTTSFSLSLSLSLSVLRTTAGRISPASFPSHSYYRYNKNVPLHRGVWSTLLAVAAHVAHNNNIQVTHTQSPPPQLPSTPPTKLSSHTLAHPHTSSGTRETPLLLHSARCSLLT